MSISELAEGNELFQQVYFKDHEAKFRELVQNGQNPKALFIGCADSRVIPNLIVQSEPGDLFVIRNVGNFVPPYRPDNDYHATAAGIEYAVNVLNVSEIIICGHSHCGACHHLYEPIEDESMVHTRKWLELGEPAKAITLKILGADAPREELYRLTEKVSVVKQLENLFSYPSVKERLKNETLYVHGWYYDIETGSIEYFDPEQHRFAPLKEIKKSAESI